MKIILLSGGSGTRLWPLSNDSRAKQFLKVLKNEQTNEMESMVQRVYRQLSTVVNKEDMIIATNAAQVDILRNQLGYIPIVVEPERRDTFPAIALASSYLWSELKISKDEIVAVVSVDSFVDVAFYEKVRQLENLLIQTNAKIALLGIKPTYPSSKYGYLIPQTITEYMQVASFKEKPTEEEAEGLIKQGAYWNSGVFAFSLQLIYKKLLESELPTQYESLISNFNKMPKNSFDYEIVEHLNNIVALTYDGYWKDLGTWNTLTEEMSQTIIGNGGISEDCNNTHIVNELELPVKVLGISNAVVAVSSDGILVTDKPSSSKMKDMLHEGLFSRPMFEERRWGWYRVLDFAKKDNQEILTKKLFVESGENLSYQYHQYRSEIWTVISGEALFILEGEVKRVKAGDVLQIPRFAKHSLKALFDTEIIEVQMGSSLIEEDIIRLNYEWEIMI